jgi:hypothetical protein
MNFCTVGEKYTIYGLPLVFRGVVDKETPLAIFLRSGTVERLLDGQTIANDENWTTPGEKLKGSVIIEKGQGLVIIPYTK